MRFNKSYSGKKAQLQQFSFREPLRKYRSLIKSDSSVDSVNHNWSNASLSAFVISYSQVKKVNGIERRVVDEETIESWFDIIEDKRSILVGINILYPFFISMHDAYLLISEN